MTGSKYYKKCWHCIVSKRAICYLYIKFANSTPCHHSSYFFTCTVWKQLFLSRVLGPRCTLCSRITKNHEHFRLEPLRRTALTWQQYVHPVNYRFLGALSLRICFVFNVTLEKHSRAAADISLRLMFVLVHSTNHSLSPPHYVIYSLNALHSFQRYSLITMLCSAPLCVW